MKIWRCPNCKRVRKFDEELVMKVCFFCQVEMEVVDDIKKQLRGATTHKGGIK